MFLLFATIGHAECPAFTDPAGAFPWRDPLAVLGDPAAAAVALWDAVAGDTCVATEEEATADTGMPFDDYRTSDVVTSTADCAADPDGVTASGVVTRTRTTDIEDLDWTTSSSVVDETTYAGANVAFPAGAGRDPLAMTLDGDIRSSSGSYGEASGTALSRSLTGELVAFDGTITSFTLEESVGYDVASSGRHEVTSDHLILDTCDLRGSHDEWLGESDDWTVATPEHTIEVTDHACGRRNVDGFRYARVDGGAWFPVGEDDWSTFADGDGDGWTVDLGDCDDTDPAVRPCADDVPADGIDADCDGTPDPLDTDGDGDPDASDCAPDDPTVYAGAPEVWYDGVDQDCDGRDDDRDGDGYGIATDCDDRDSGLHPGAPEVWYDGIDEDCDGNDRDRDGDGFVLAVDCDDTDPAVHEGCGARASGEDRADEGDRASGCGCASPGAPGSAALASLIAAIGMRRARRTR